MTLSHMQHVVKNAELHFCGFIKLLGKIKSLCLINYAQRQEDVWGSGGIDPALLISKLDRGQWSASRHGRFTPGEETPGTTG
jgi:hypothetical protein